MEQQSKCRYFSPLTTHVTFSAMIFLWFVLRMRGRGRRCRRSSRCGGAGGRKGVEPEFVAHAGVGRVGGRPLQIGGVLNGQKIFVKRGGVGVLGGGGILRAALGGLLRGRGRAKSLPRGGEGGGLGVRPTLEFERGQIALHGGDDDVGAV